MPRPEGRSIRQVLQRALQRGSEPDRAAMPLPSSRVHATEAGGVERRSAGPRHLTRSRRPVRPYNGARTANLDDTRRRFMTHFASVGLGSTLVPGIVWARMQDQGTQRVTLAMVTEALKLQGLDLPEADLQAMVNGANQNLTRYEEVRKMHIPLDVSPPFHFSALAPGIEPNRTRLPFRISAAPAVKRPANLEDVAFWPVRHLAELVRTKQVKSIELTEMYLARLHRYQPKLNFVVTFLDDLARAQAKAADAEIAAGKYKGPLHGIPWAAKDIISVKGYKTTWGAKSLQDQQFDYDASVVEQLHEAGAVLIAKVTTGELAQGDQ